MCHFQWRRVLPTSVNLPAIDDVHLMVRRFMEKELRIANVLLEIVRVRVFHLGYSRALVDDKIVDHDHVQIVVRRQPNSERRAAKIRVKQVNGRIARRLVAAQTTRATDRCPWAATWCERTDS